MGYAVSSRQVAVRGGWWSRWWRLAEVDKIQALRLQRTPVDRWLGTASLLMDTAGAGAMSPPLRIRFLPEAEARELQARLGRLLAQLRLRMGAPALLRSPRNTDRGGSVERACVRLPACATCQRGRLACR